MDLREHRCMNRREFIRTAAAATLASNGIVLRAASLSLHCTPSPVFPVPLTEGAWRSQPFPVGAHDYNVLLHVDRPMSYGGSDCDLDPRPEFRCDMPPRLDIDWKIWDGTTAVRNRTNTPIRPAAWGDHVVGFVFGGFQGRKNAHFTLEWNVRRDPGTLKDLNPRVQIVKYPGYWCWL
jgi:hypothetical protein